MATKRFLAKNGLDNNNQTITNVASPVNTTDAVNKSITDGILTYAQSAYGLANAVSTVNSTQNTNISSVNTFAASAYTQANTDYTTISTSAGNYGGTTAIPVITVAANGRISAVTNTSITAGATITDDTTSNASRYIVFGTATSGTFTIANTSSTKLTYNPSTGTLTSTVFSGSGASLTSLTAGNLSGTIPSGVLGNSSLYVGTTAIALNRSSASQSLTGVNIDGSAGSVAASALTGTTLASGVTASSLTSVGTITSGTWSGSFGAVSGANLTGLTAGNLSGTIPSAVLGNSTHYIGTTAIALNRSSASQALTGITSIDGSAATFTSTSQNSQFNSIGVGTAATSTAGEIRATGTITANYSDDQLKTKLGNIPNAVDKIKSLNGFYYEPNEVAQSLGYEKRKEVGLSAQQVQKVLPEIVVPAPIDEKYLTIHYERLVPLLVEAIKEQQNQIDKLTTIIKEINKG